MYQGIWRILAGSMEEGAELMKDVLFTLARFYVEYRINVLSLRRRFWIHIDREWFHLCDPKTINKRIRENLK